MECWNAGVLGIIGEITYLNHITSLKSTISILHYSIIPIGAKSLNSW
jgi:hypothetical protein